MIFGNLLHFFTDNFPSAKSILVMGPVYLAWCTVVLWFAGRMKQKGVKTGYTRKIFHFLIFSSVVILQWLLGTDAVLLFGAMCTLLVFYAVYRGDGHIFYEALAREKDAPRRRWFVLLPWLTTGIGGVAGNLFFGHLAIAGYLVTGLGDAIGEPAGTRFRPVIPIKYGPCRRSLPSDDGRVSRCFSGFLSGGSPGCPVPSGIERHPEPDAEGIGYCPGCSMYRSDHSAWLG